MDALTVFSHGTIPQRAEKLQRHRYRLQAFHAAIGNHLAGRREILQYPLDNNSTSHERMLVAGQQTLHAVPPPIGIQTLTGIGDQSHLDWSAIIFSEGDWRTCVQLKPEFAALAAAGSLTGLLAMRACNAIQRFLVKIMGPTRLPSAEAYVYEGCLNTNLVREAQNRDLKLEGEAYSALCDSRPVTLAVMLAACETSLIRILVTTLGATSQAPAPIALSQFPLLTVYDTIMDLVAAPPAVEALLLFVEVQSLAGSAPSSDTPAAYATFTVDVLSALERLEVLAEPAHPKSTAEARYNLSGHV